MNLIMNLLEQHFSQRSNLTNLNIQSQIIIMVQYKHIFTAIIQPEIPVTVSTLVRPIGTTFFSKDLTLPT